jgi:hypothetical protein
MLSDISGRFMQVIEMKRRKEKLERDLQRVQERLAERSALAVALDRQLKKEQVDVERLEKLSLAGLFYAVLGSKEQQMEKERQEMLAAQLKYQQAKADADALRSEQESIERELRALGGVDREYTSLLAEKETLLRQGSPQTSAELLRLSEEIAGKNAQRREIEEAIAAAKDVLGSLDEVIGSLESAEGWGTWDMLGGGFLVTAAKHSRIDEARDGVHAVQAKLNRFTRELADVQRSADIRIDISALEGFADFFFDGLLMDWIVQSKIADSLHQTRQAKAQVKHTAAHLTLLRNETVQQAERLAEQRRALIEGA